MILMIDNYDSFTYNIVQYFGELGAELTVHRNDMIDISEIEKINPEKIVISPGPCTPNEAGISVEVVKRFYKIKPILGICLGHQSIGQAFNGRIITANLIMHGKTSSIFHNENEIFSKVNNPFDATRYHSLVVEKKTLPECLEITAWSKDNNIVDEIMGIKHKQYPTYGLQFHPESILTEPGHQLLKNFLEL
ncbi:MAG: aminodeoxychorismate/anthranilate synthase component II [Pseudomonadota bacterium]|nr:aminodeoxychorismate/anthranilate synthase component II [Pseudomonadota bacterium]MEC8996032.1 aminodeoxychorismate/anthranilate synthase component II [Pseudomonadota bacterium]MED5430558.1 aminodeoxychorismate/anthranilate synthase component II [Pseudomonadota bacterium]|tara:strand:- start:170 stop:745 length:576 start_codon:yes stop_codon:yes gene_type:complete